MTIAQLPLSLREISQHMKIIRFGFMRSKKDPWEKITGLFKIGKKIAIEDIVKQKGFEDGQQYIQL